MSVPLTLSPEQLRRRRRRSIALGAALAALAVMFYFITMAKLGANLFERAL